MNTGKMKLLSLLLAFALLGGLLITDSASAAAPFLSITPSVNFVKIKNSEDVNFDGTDGWIQPSQSKWDTAPGIGITAGIIAYSNWQLGLGYEFIGQIKNNKRDFTRWIGGSDDGDSVDLIEKFNLHNIQLQGRYNFLPADNKVNFFAYGKVGVTVAQGKFHELAYDAGVRDPAEDEGGKKTKTLFSYGLGAGASYSFTPKLSGELSGEFFQTARGRFASGDSNIKHSALGFKIAAGLTLKF
jgi:opacity protein-like surface antigen